MAKNEIPIHEYPLAGPYEFEGFLGPEELLYGVSGDTERVAMMAAQSGVGVVRAGENTHGTWGYLAIWNGSKWEHKGYTLEPRSSVGKGPIPLGDFQFRQWMSEKLGKTLRLANVPGFTNILIHVGNTQGDTQGCILAAKQVDNVKNPTRLVDSRTITDWLYDNCAEGRVLVRSA